MSSNRPHPPYTNAVAVAVAVADDGPGIPEGERDHVFDRFYRGPGSRNDVSGVGLGLPVAAAIAIRHHGSIAVGASDLGGAEFRIVMPLLRPASDSGGNH